MLIFSMKTLEWRLIPQVVFNFKSEDNDPYLQSINNDHESEFIFFAQSFQETKYELRNLLDIGANIGLKCIPTSLFFEKTFAVEANTKVFDFLNQNISENNRKNIETLNVACGYQEQRVKFNQNSAWGHVDGTGEEIQCITLNQVLDKFNITEVSLCKIDVEGYESKILTNFDSSQKKIDFLWIEFNSWCLMAFGETNPEQFLNFLTTSYHFVGQIKKIENNILQIKEITKKNYKEFLYEHIFQKGCVDDLLLVSDEENGQLVKNNKKLRIE